jgi:hypothetical protein
MLLCDGIHDGADQNIAENGGVRPKKAFYDWALINLVCVHSFVVVFQGSRKLSCSLMDYILSVEQDLTALRECPLKDQDPCSSRCFSPIWKALPLA